MNYGLPSVFQYKCYKEYTCMIKILIDNIDNFIVLKKIKYFEKIFMLNLSANKIESIESPELHALVISDLLTPDSTTKKTCQHRFQEIDKVLLSLLDERKSYSIHDTAVSNGITSVDLCNALKSMKIRFHLTISDKLSNLNVLEFDNIIFVYTDDYELVYGKYMKIACVPNASYKFILSKLFGKLLKYRWDRINICNKIASKKINLVHKNVQYLIEKGKIEYISYDIFNAIIVNSFDIVRCMNVLNLCYFSRDKIVSAIRNIALSLREGGILQLGRTENSGQNKVSFYIKNNNKFEIIHEISGGYELNDIVLSLSFI